MNQLVFDNPILMKHIRCRLRQPHALLIVTLVLSGCVMWAGYELEALANGGMFTFLIFGVGIVIQLGGTSQVASSISQTNDTGILDFHRVSPLPPHVATLGFVLGGPIREYAVAAVIFPFAAFCAVIGEPGILGLASISIVLLTTTLLFHMLAMNAGILSRRGKTRGANMGLAFLIILVSGGSASVFAGLPIPGLLTAGPAFAEAMGQLPARANLPTFFGLNLPLFVQSLIYQIPVIVFLTIPVVRKMRSAQASIYSKKTAVACLATFSMLNIGGIVNHPLLAPELFVPMLLYGCLLVSILLTLAVTPSQGSYMNHVRRSRKHNMLKPSLWADESCNRIVILIFGSLTWATVQVVEMFMAQGNFDTDFLVMTGTAIAVIVYFGSAAQFFALKFGRKHLPMLFLFLFFFWLMPLIVAGLVGATFGEDAGLLIAPLSPIYGIGAASIPGLIAAFVLAAIFFSLMIREERRIQEDSAGDPFEEEVEELLDDAFV